MCVAHHRNVYYCIPYVDSVLQAHFWLEQNGGISVPLPAVLPRANWELSSEDGGHGGKLWMLCVWVVEYVCVHTNM